MIIRCRKISMFTVIGLFTLLFGVSHQLDKKPAFIATFSSSVIPGSYSKFCISFENIASSIEFTFTNEGSNPCFSKLEKLVDSTKLSCFDIWIEESCKDKSDLKIFLYGSSSDGTYKFNDTKYSGINQKNYLRFIETDKPVYKPGDKLRIRVLTLDFQMKPLVKKFKEIFVQDSSSTRVNQWIDIEDKTGLIDLDMPISTEPNFGIWQIKIIEENEKQVSVNFEVKKYVLPKFEVMLKHPKKIWPQSKTMNVQVCAKYSHGNNVKGDFELKSFTKQFSFKSYKNEIHKTITKSIKGKGCVNFNIQLSDLEISMSTFIYSIYFEAKVTEDKTNIIMEKSSNIQISFNNFQVDLLENTDYKPGFKTNFKLNVKNAEEIPFSNEEIKVSLERNSKTFYQKSMTTDNDGNLLFSYDPNNCDECKNLEGSDKPSTFYLKVDSLNGAGGQSFPIAPWYTEKNSYISINKPLGLRKLKCGETFNSEIIVKVANPALFSEKLNFQLQSRSNFSIIGHYDLKSDKIFTSNDENRINFKISRKSSRSIAKIVPNHNQTFDINGNPNYEHQEYVFELSFEIFAEMTPKLNLLIYYIYENEIIPDTLSIELDKCLQNKVSIELEKPSLRVARPIDIVIRSEPNSICGLSAIDKSVSFMGARNSIDTNKIFEVISQFDLVDWYLNNYESSKECANNRPFYPMPRFQVPDIVRKRMIYPGFGSQFVDPSKSFNDARIVYFSDLKIYKNCRSFPYYAVPRSKFIKAESYSIAASFENDVAFMKTSADETVNVVQDEEKIISIRQFFPETWIWSIELTDQNGLVTKKEKTPDTITDWLLDAYCLSNKGGIGVSETTLLKVFQPLFLSINLPYSVIRYETFPVYATIFNYYSSCIPVEIEIRPSAGIGVISSKTERLCVCPDDEKTHKFDLRAVEFSDINGFKIDIKVRGIDNTNNVCNAETEKVIKNVTFYDSETKTVIVEPEGIPKEIVKSYLFVFKQNKIVMDQVVNMSLPENVIPKSSRAFLRITGDAVGAALNNLDNLVQQPTGCGEQNMVKFAPLVSVANYLKNTDQLSLDKEKKIKEYLTIGYQRQLTYRHKDGSFSAFGPKSTNEGGGTWLTAFVLRCLADSYDSKLIQIDPKDIELSLDMLCTTAQDKDGSFKQVGAPLLSKALSGGLKDKKVGLSAYVMLSIVKAVNALKGSNISPEIQQSLANGVVYLSSSLKDISNIDTYSLALIHNVFKILNTNQESIDLIDNELDNRAVKEGNFVYWKDKNQDEESYYSQSADLEITSYILISRLINNKNVADLVPIARWINSNRNSLGGFHSTQDTVVALEALSKFASLSYSKNIYLKLNYEINSIQQTYYVNNVNRLISYTRKLDFKENDVNKFTFGLNGYGTVLIEFIIKYNLAEEKTIAKDGYEFGIEQISSGKCDNIKLKINARKNGDENSGSMVIIDVRLPSGFEANEDLINSLTNTHDLRRYELNQNKISLYFDELTLKGKNFEIEVFQKFEIKDLKPGYIVVYDYYEPLNKQIGTQFEIKNC